MTVNYHLTPPTAKHKTWIGRVSVKWWNEIAEGPTSWVAFWAAIYSLYLTVQLED